MLASVSCLMVYKTFSNEAWPLIPRQSSLSKGGLVFNAWTLLELNVLVTVDTGPHNIGKLSWQLGNRVPIFTRVQIEHGLRVSPDYRLQN